MNKYQRHEAIIRWVNEQGTVRVSEIVSRYNVSDMTVRRDLEELDDQGLLKKIHGGARSNSAFQYKEIAHEDKFDKNTDQKRYIAQRASELIDEGDVIFIGPGTTTALFAEEINHQALSVVTNCLPIFNILLKKKSETFHVYLLGGEMRSVTQSFVGEITNMSLENMRFGKMFFGGNGVKDGIVMTSSVAEAYTQKMALEHSVESYLLLDSSKVGKEDFSKLCHLSDLTAVLMEESNEDKKQAIQVYTELIV